MVQGTLEFTHELTVAEARRKLLEERRKGTVCPCCDQYVKIYKRQIYGSMARGLIRLYCMDQKHKSNMVYFHVSAIADNMNVGTALSKLAYWNLIEEMPKDDSEVEKKTSGFWRITEEGRQFVRGVRTVSKYILLYDSHLLGFEGGQRTIQQCLGKQFNYQELMNEFINANY